MKDTRIPYGAFCTWWDSIDKVGKMAPHRPGAGLPCCPHCGGPLYEVESEDVWFKGVDRHEANGHPGYRVMVEWARGKCFRNYEAMEAAYPRKHLQ